MRVQLAFASGAMLAVFGMPSPATAQQAEFHDLGYLNAFTFGTSYTAGLSADGSTVVGRSTNSDGTNDWTEAFRWTATDGMVGLGYLNAYTTNASLYGLALSVPTAVSANGSAIAGYSTNSDGTDDWIEAFRWSETDGMVGLGYLHEYTNGYRLSIATGISGDGSIVVGESSNSDGMKSWREAFRWTASDGMLGLGYLSEHTDGTRHSLAQAISADGLTIVGQSSNSDGSADWLEAYRWTVGDGMTGLGFLDVHTTGYRQSSAAAVSADGSVIAGYSSNSDGSKDWSEAFRWTEAEGMVGLGYLNDYTTGPRSSQASLISADGSTVIGDSTNSDGTRNWFEAFRWTADNGMVGLGFLGTPSGSAGENYARSLSADGSVIVGLSSTSTPYVYGDFRWSVDGGMQSVADWLGPDVDLTGMLLGADVGYIAQELAPFVSADGSTVAGTLTRADGSQTAYLARVGGLITPDAAAASFGEIASLAVGLGNAIDTSLASFEGTARHLQCRTTDGKPTSYCVFGSIEGAGTIGSADNEFLSGTGNIGIAAQGGNGLSFGARIGGSYQTNDLALGGSADVDRFETGLQLAYLPQTGPQLALSAVASTLSVSIDRRYMNGAGTTVSSGDTDGWGLGARAMLGWSFVAPVGRLTPYGSYTVTDIQLDGWAETSGPFPARFDDVSSTLQITRLGLEDEVQLTDRAAFWIDGAWAHSFGNSDDISGELIDLFEVGLPIRPGDRDWLEATAGLRYTVAESAVIAGSVTIAAYPESETAAFGRLTLTKGF